MTAMNTIVTTDAHRQAFEHRVANYVDTGWEVVDRQANPPRARLIYSRRRRSSNPAPLAPRDTGERVIWIDEAGEVRVKQMEG